MLRVAVVGLLIASLFQGAQAQESPQSFPSKPVKEIAPFGAGGTADIVARFTAERLSRVSGQQFVVENRAGAAGSIAMETLKRAPKDGYTLVITSQAPVVILPHLRKTSYDPIADFTAVSMIATSIVGLAIHPSIPAKDFKEFVAYAKANPGKLHYGSAGIGSSQHIRNEMLSRALDLGLVHVPYKSAGEAMIDVVAGQIQVMGEAVVFEHARAGRLRVLAVYDTQRHPDFPDAPIIGEASGKPDIAMPAWVAAFVPAGTPDGLVERLNGLLAEAMNHEETRARMYTQGYRVNHVATAEANAIVRKDS